MSLILYPSTERTFLNNGIGILSDAISCNISSELNGIDELTMQYPVDGIHANQIDLRSILLAPRNHADQPQPYRIYDISEPMNGIVTISARHISYDLLGIPVQPYSAQNITQALAGLSQYAATECPFTFSTQRTTEALFSVAVPSVIRSLLGGQQGSLLDVYGGEYEFDRFSVILHTKRGQNRGVTIRYGKNLTDIQQDKNCESVYTGVYPYWVGSDGTLVMLSEKILSASGTYDFENILPLDLSTEWEERPTETQLRTRANRYMTDNQIGSPTVSMTVSFVQLADTEEYKDASELEQVELGDTVTIYFPRLRTESTARVVAMEYDAILNRYISITLGSVRSNIADTIVKQSQEISRVSDPSYIQSVSGTASEIITGNRGGYVVLHSSTGEPWPDEILVMDQPSPQTAKQVWRWNKSGLGYSANGYNGEYKQAMTIDGKFVADFISTGTLNAADLIVKNFMADNLKSEAVDELGNPVALEATGGTLKYFINGKSRIEIALPALAWPMLSFRRSDGSYGTTIAEEYVKTPLILPDDRAYSHMEWVYLAEIGKTVLCKTM